MPFIKSNLDLDTDVMYWELFSIYRSSRLCSSDVREVQLRDFDKFLVSTVFAFNKYFSKPLYHSILESYVIDIYDSLIE